VNKLSHAINELSLASVDALGTLTCLSTPLTHFHLEPVLFAWSCSPVCLIISSMIGAKKLAHGHVSASHNVTLQNVPGPETPSRLYQSYQLKLVLGYLVFSTFRALKTTESEIKGTDCGTHRNRRLQTHNIACPRI
jgi:hypothetical protein